MDRVFRALADPSRRQLLDSLDARNGQTLGELCSGRDMTRQAVSKHLAVLEEANLVATVRRGREKLHYLNAAPIAEIADRWISRYDRPRVRALADLKRALEEPPMDLPDFVYTTYIRTTPERLWRALTDPAFTSRYWGCSFRSDWQAGSTYALEQAGVRIADPEQKVLVSDPPRRLSYTWHTFSPEWVEAVGSKAGFGDEQLARMAAEPRSRVTFEIEPLDDVVKLTVVHDGFEPGSEVAGGISQGWPRVLAELKTLLESGEPVSEPELAAAAPSSPR
ncbi:MAG TPA: metalloregulator ArsR/SmtB family transcription factor [Acidimicrobiales bacterium]|nr:metalloregulator ArsR/SmtB family transcription factor [Acidimicrobiales bacterium]